MKSLTRTRAVGGSLIITIPSEIVKEKSLKEGELVEIDVEKIKQSYFGRFKGIGPMTQEDKFKGQLEE
jgi:antitoxin component of MazEF toxin-antitoxin module